MRSPLLRSILALLLFSAWLALLFAGLAAGGAVHLLLVGAAVLFPWRVLGEKDYKDSKDFKDDKD